MQESSSSLFTTTFSLSVGQSSKTVQVSLEVRDDENTWTTSEGRMTKTYTIRRGQDRHFYLKDHLGSVRVTVDEEGEPLGFDDFYPYGLQMPTRSSNTANPNDRYKFTGHERDTEAGLTFDYMGARTYDPLLGIFMQIDPLMEFSTPYSYVGANPVNLTDPTGMSSEDCADRGVGDEFSAEFASPCTRSEVRQAEIERKKDKSEAEQNSGFNTEYGISIDGRFFEKEIKEVNGVYGDGSAREEHMYHMQKMVRKYGAQLKALFGKGGKFSNTSLTILFEPYTHGSVNQQNSPGQFTFGDKDTPVSELFDGSKDGFVADFGPDELQMVLYINPNEFSGWAGGTPKHEMRHALYTLSSVTFGDPIMSGGNQHWQMNKSKQVHGGVATLDFETYLFGLLQY